MKLNSLAIHILWTGALLASFTQLLFGVWMLPQFLNFAKDLKMYFLLEWILPIGILFNAVLFMLIIMYIFHSLDKEKEDE